ncbi:hypothetical protein [Brunnivagina elsteri]|uniref:hypothetical protein n=1 Tax=Brunnivagina elsteri TaxID=1247191 RepID=UPI001178230C|nr:hypothetical protein [Calothrix elsteri]
MIDRLGILFSASPQIKYILRGWGDPTPTIRECFFGAIAQNIDTGYRYPRKYRAFNVFWCDRIEYLCLTHFS